MLPLRHRPVVHVATALLSCAALATVALAACGTPPELRPPKGVPVPSPTRTAGPSASPGTPYPSLPPSSPPWGMPTPGMPTPAPTASGFPESYAVPCAGRPTGGQVIRVARRSGNLLPAGAHASVETGPLCSGTWQYTVLSVPGRGLLAVVTRGAPTVMTLVTAGTDVCSVSVRVEAPPGIRSAATCM